jgi:hypothetical protein
MKLNNLIIPSNYDSKVVEFNYIINHTRKGNYYMTIQNNPSGLDFYKQFKKLNRGNFKFIARGRAADRRAALKSIGRKYNNMYAGNSNELGIKGSDRFVVYIDSIYR